MLDNLPADIRIWSEKYVGVVQSTQSLKGGISTSIFHLKTHRGDFVLRVIDNAEWLAEEPDLAAHEAAALKAVAAIPVPTPELIAFDNGEMCSLPVVLSTLLPGAVVLKPDNLQHWLKELAETLAKIHAVDVPEYQLQCETEPLAIQFPSPPAHIPNADLWQKVIAVSHNLPPDNHICLLHRDYHPANVLFLDGLVSGVVDWINACCGPAGIDVASCRNDLVCLYGIEAADQFKQYYEAASGTQHHAYWDLWALADFYDEPMNATRVLQSWHDLGRTDLNETLIYQRANAYCLGLISQLLP